MGFFVGAADAEEGDSGGEDVKPNQLVLSNRRAEPVRERVYYASDTNDEYINVEKRRPWKVDQMNCSARLIHADLEILLNNYGCLLLVDDSFIAKVEPINANLLGQATSFTQAKIILLR